MFSDFGDNWTFTPYETEMAWSIRSVSTEGDVFSVTLTMNPDVTNQKHEFDIGGNMTKLPTCSQSQQILWQYVVQETQS